MLVFQEEQELLQKAIREFAAEQIGPYAASWDEEDRCPQEIFAKLGDIGIAGVFIPEEYSGEGLDYVSRAICLEEIASFSAGFAMAIMTHHLGVSTIVDAGTEEQKRKYLPDLAAGTKIAGLSTTEPSGGSDFMGQQAIAEFDGKNWHLSGRKCFITNSHIADVDIWTARTGTDAKGRPAISTFILEKEDMGHNVGRKENKLGLRGSVTGEVTCDNVCLPADRLLGQEGEGVKIGMRAIGEVGRAGMAAIGVGLLRACLNESVKFAKERIIYGKPLSALQSAQFIIAENRTAYEAARLLLYNAVSLKDAGKPCSPAIAMAKLFATEEAVAAAKRTMDLMGAYGCINEYPVGRYMRDALVCLPSGGTSHIHKLVISGAALKE